MLGIYSGKKARFMKGFLAVRTDIDEAAENYVKAVKVENFQGSEYGVSVRGLNGAWRLLPTSHPLLPRLGRESSIAFVSHDGRAARRPLVAGLYRSAQSALRGDKHFCQPSAICTGRGFSTDIPARWRMTALSKKRGAPRGFFAPEEKTLYPVPYEFNVGPPAGSEHAGRENFA